MRTANGIERGRERINFWKSADLAGMEFLHARYVDHVFSRHVHESYAIGVVTGGVERFRAGGVSHVACPGEIIIVNPDTPHDGEAARRDGWRYRMIYPSAAAVMSVAEEMGAGGPPIFPDAVIRDRILSRRLLTLHSAAEAAVPATLAQQAWRAVVARLLELSGTPVRDDTGRRMERKKVRAARRYIADHFDRNVTLAELACAVGLSPYYLQRAFKGETGLSPYDYLMHVRMETARLLLRQGEPPASVAAACGFADQSHFGRRFKAMLGVTPGGFQKAA